jgi:hypothetical protein
MPLVLGQTGRSAWIVFQPLLITTARDTFLPLNRRSTNRRHPLFTLNSNSSDSMADNWRSHTSTQALFSIASTSGHQADLIPHNSRGPCMLGQVDIAIRVDEAEQAIPIMEGNQVNGPQVPLRIV